MNDNTPRRGDRIYFNYGVYCGEDFGTVLAEIPNKRWGSQWLVRLDDFTTKQIDVPCGTVTEHDGIVEGAKGIGAYIIER